MNEILIKVADNVNKFKEGDILVYNKDKTFSTININDVIDKKLKTFEAKQTELTNEARANSKRCKHEIKRFGELVDNLQKALRGGKNDD